VWFVEALKEKLQKIAAGAPSVGAERGSFTASVGGCGPGGVNGVGVIARGQAVVARRDGLRDGGLTEGTHTERQSRGNSVKR
jgi:hypothetical protein